LITFKTTQKGGLRLAIKEGRTAEGCDVIKESIGEGGLEWGGEEKRTQKITDNFFARAKVGGVDGKEDRARDPPPESQRNQPDDLKNWEKGLRGKDRTRKGLYKKSLKARPVNICQMGKKESTSREK